MRKILVGTGIIFILLILFMLALFGGYVCSFLKHGGQITDKYEVFRDVLIIVLTVLIIGLTIISIVIGVFAYLTYRYASSWIERRVKEVAETERHYSSAYILTTSGYVYWLDYTKTKDNEYLEKAINLTERAYSEHSSHLDIQERKNQRLICVIRNNLGYYLAERGKKEDREFACECAEYIRSKIIDFPEVKGRFADTIAFIKQRYP